MHIDLVNMSLGFIEGLALIFSPCIWPILPIILSGSIIGNKSRPLGIIVGFIIMFSVVIMFTRTIIQIANINPDTLRLISLILLFLLGAIMLSDYLSERFSIITQGFTRVGRNSKLHSKPGFFSGVWFGALVGIVWTPCAGPLLAAVIVQVVIQETTLSSLLTVIAFAFGAAVPMLMIAFLGRSVIAKLNFFRSHPTFVRKILGVIIILSVLLLTFNPELTTNAQPINPSLLNGTQLENGLVKPYLAPPLKSVTAWINSPPLQLNQLQGKVVLIDFWTYTCINCIRTLPYLNDWYAKYHVKGFEIIGIHSPEFEFEHDVNNVKLAVQKYKIRYPVAIDNDFVNWQNYKNRYWPALYLINKNGEVMYTHFGEGDYAIIENNIIYLLNSTFTNK